MDGVWSRMLRSIYRREPVVAFVVTVGAVDAAIGGLSEHYSLLAVGLGTVSVAIALRLWQQQRRQPLEQPSRPPVHLLPDRSSSRSLPMLSMSKKQPPGRL
jgi:hypothetical protein